MFCSTKSTFVLKNERGTVVELDLIAAVQLIQFIGYRRGSVDHPGTCYRYEAKASKPYRNRVPSDSGMKGEYSHFTLEWAKSKWNHDHNIILRLGEEIEKVTIEDVCKLYNALKKYIRHEMGGSVIPFPLWSQLAFHLAEANNFTGYAFSEQYPGKLVEYRDGAVLNEKVVSHFAYTENVNVPRPEWINNHCFGIREYRYLDCQYIILEE